MVFKKVFSVHSRQEGHYKNHKTWKMYTKIMYKLGEGRLGAVAPSQAKQIFGQSLNFACSSQQPKMKKVNNFSTCINQKNVIHSVQRNEVPKIRFY